MNGSSSEPAGGSRSWWRRREVLVGGLAFAAGTAAAGAVSYGLDWRDDRRRSREPGELTMISGVDLSAGRQRRALIDRWNLANPQYPVRMIELAGVADDHYSEMVARAQADEPSVDIYNLDVTWIPEFARFGYIRSLDASDFDRDAFLAPPWRTCWYDGELWALPFNTDAGLLFVWEDLIGQLEPDRLTWETIAQLVAGAERPAGMEAGYAGQHANYEGLTVNALERIWAAQILERGEVDVADLWDPTRDVDSYDIESAVCALAAAQVVGEGGTTGEDDGFPLIMPESVDFAEPETTRAFQDRKVLFMRNWPIAYRSDGPAEDDGDLPLPGVWKLPGRSVLGGQNLAIDRRSPRWRVAQDLIRFLTHPPEGDGQPDSQRQLFLEGGLAATRRDLYDDAEIRGRYPYAGKLREAVETAGRRPETPYYVQFSEVFRDGVYAAITAGECALPPDFTDQLEAALTGRLPSSRPPG